MKKPRLFSKVYIVQDWEIKKMFVYAKSKRTFIVSASKDYYWNDNEYDEQEYGNYNNTWYSNLRDAKDCLKIYFRDCVGEEPKFVKYDGDLWEATL